MKNISKKLSITVFSLLLTGCVVNPLLEAMIADPNRDTPAFQNVYDNKSAQLDQMAKAGQITWVEAATRRREADRTLANNKAGYYTSWKFDSSDEEFHAYCIALAEKLDQKQITFAQYDSARIAKFNQIQARNSSQTNQARILQLQQSNQLLLQQQQRQQEINQNRTFNCNTFGSTTTCR